MGRLYALTHAAHMGGELAGSQMMAGSLAASRMLGGGWWSDFKGAIVAAGKHVFTGAKHVAHVVAPVFREVGNRIIDGTAHSALQSIERGQYSSLPRNIVTAAQSSLARSQLQRQLQHTIVGAGRAALIGRRRF